MVRLLGWDIGAANVKAALWVREEGSQGYVRVAAQPFEIWRDRERLPDVLQSVYNSVGVTAVPHAMAVTMTAELSDVFLTKREGVIFVLNSLRSAFPNHFEMYVFSLKEDFARLEEARMHPLDFAASNWLATAKWVAGQIPNCLVVDVGSTTTDILPIIDCEPEVWGRSDLERLASGELVYTGALRTNLAAIVGEIPVRGRSCRVASEYFAISGDVHLVLGNLSLGAYTCPTPDGQPVSVDSARRRIARLVCADTEMLAAEQIDEIARYLCDRQVRQIQSAIMQVRSRISRVREMRAVVLGSGAFLGVAAAQRAGLEIVGMKPEFGPDELAVAPCIAVVQLLDKYLRLGKL